MARSASTLDATSLCLFLAACWTLAPAATPRSNHILTPTPGTATTPTMDNNNYNYNYTTPTMDNNNYNYNNTTTAPSAAGSKPPGPRGGRRCKCVKRLKKELSQVIEDRLQDFHARYLLPLHRHHPQNHQQNRPHHPVVAADPRKTEGGDLQRVDRRLHEVSGEVANTKAALTLMQRQLQQLRRELGGVAEDVEALNVSWGQLDRAVSHVSHFVAAVEKVLPPSGGALCPPSAAAEGYPPFGRPAGETFPRNCDEVYQRGGMQFQGDYYIMIKPEGVTDPFKVLCKSFNNAGWTVIQRRLDGSVDFFRGWADYKAGFGSLQGEFWLGNDYIHHLTMQGPTMLRIELTDWEDRKYYATYDSFRLEDEQGLYRLHVAGYHGNAGDSLKSRLENHDGMPFSTKDRDNDGRYYDNCAENFHGAWWFNNCFDSHLNGKYYRKGLHEDYFQRDGVLWNSIHAYSSLQNVQMMLRPAPPQVSLSDLDLIRENKVKDVHSGRSRKERGRG